MKRLKNILLNINSGDGISNDELVEDGEIEVYGGGVSRFIVATSNHQFWVRVDGVEQWLAF